MLNRYFLNCKKFVRLCRYCGFVEALYRITSKIRDRQRVVSIDLEQFSIPEVTLLKPERAETGLSRLNLLIPSLEKRHVFGGISTAIKVFCRLAVYYPEKRIVITDSLVTDLDHEIMEMFATLVGQTGDLQSCLVPMGDRYGKKIPVGKHAVFLATAWWTAYILEPILAWQYREFAIKPFFYYLIQDYEPGFYSWSSKFAMAESTYKSKFDTRAVINSKFLYEFFQDQGY